jgi:ATP-dependent protease Clp ATPase subunit
MYDLPSSDEVKEVVITAGVIDKTERPLIIYQSEKMAG